MWPSRPLLHHFPQTVGGCLGLLGYDKLVHMRDVCRTFRLHCQYGCSLGVTVAASVN